MRNKILSIALLTNLAFIGAQENVKLDEVVTSGRIYPEASAKVNESYIVISKNDLKSIPTQTVEEVISYYSGIDLRRRGIDGMQSDVSIRGGGFEQVLLLINGVRVTNPQSAHNLWNIPFDVSAIERIEIIKGPSATKYGANAFAGVINIVTTVNSGDTGYAKVQAGSFGSYKGALGVNLDHQNLKQRLDVSYGASDGYRFNTDYSKKNIFYQNTYDLNNGKIDLQAGFGEKKFGANGFYASPKFTEQYEEVQNSIVSIGFNKKINNWGIQSKSYWTRSQDRYTLIKSKPSIYQNFHIGNNLGIELSASHKNKLGVTSFGSDYRKEILRSNNLGARDRSIVSFFAEHNFSFVDNKLNIVPGISWSNFSNVGHFLYPSLEVGYQLDNNNKLYGNASKVHRIPSYTELYYNSKTDIGNPNLKPETAISYELGYKYLQNGLSAQLSLFYRDTNNGIDFVKNDESEAWKTFNNSEFITKGAEVNLKKDMDGFIKSMQLGYTYIDKSVDTREHKYSKYALSNLRNQLILGIENRITSNINTMVNYRYLDRVTMDNYSLLDAKINYNLNNWSVFTSFNNILGTKYIETNLVEMPGFWFSGGVEYKFGF